VIKKNEVKFSVIIPSFNDYRILRTIDSITNQTYKSNNIEIVIIDNNSNKKILDSIKKKLRKNDQIIVDKDNGIFFAINNGINKCSNKYIFTIGTDDYLNNKMFFKKLSDQIIKNKPDLIFFGVNYITNNNFIFRKWPPYKLNFLSKFIGRQFAHFGMVCTQDLYRKYNYFDTSLKPNADFDFFYKLNVKKINIIYLKFFPVNMTFGGDSAKDIKTFILVNLKILYIIITRYPIFTLSFFIKPIHKILEVTIFRLIYKN
jgi:glycosyltransferase